MLIRLKKTRDGVVLTCLRDGSDAAIQRTAHAGFFALHDLMHYAVETTLGFDQAFFGLMAAGWSFDTFGDQADPRYKSMPVQAVHAEHLVATLSRLYPDPAWRDGQLLPLFTDDLNRELSATLAAAGLPGFQLTPVQLASIFHCFADLAHRWSAVPVGEHLELTFP